MISEEGEKVPFKKSFNPKDSMGNVERWLIECEAAMRESLKDTLQVWRAYLVVEWFMYMGVEDKTFLQHLCTSA